MGGGGAGARQHSPRGGRASPADGRQTPCAHMHHRSPHMCMPQHSPQNTHTCCVDPHRRSISVSPSSYATVWRTCRGSKSHTWLPGGRVEGCRVQCGVPEIKSRAEGGSTSGAVLAGSGCAAECDLGGSSLSLDALQCGTLRCPVRSLCWWLLALLERPHGKPFCLPPGSCRCESNCPFSILGAAATPPPARSSPAANSNASRLQRRLGGPQLPLGRPRTKPRLLKGPRDQLSPAALAQG